MVTGLFGDNPGIVVAVPLCNKPSPVGSNVRDQRGGRQRVELPEFSQKRFAKGKLIDGEFTLRAVRDDRRARLRPDLLQPMTSGAQSIDGI